MKTFDSQTLPSNETKGSYKVRKLNNILILDADMWAIKYVAKYI